MQTKYFLKYIMMTAFKIYAQLIVRRAYLILSIVSTLCTVLTICPLFLHSFPSFSDPIAGFETRGTALAHRFIAWDNLVEETRPSGKLAGNPKDIEDQIRISEQYNKTLQKKVNVKKNKTKLKSLKLKKNKVSKKKNEQDTNRNGFPSAPHIHWAYGNYVNFENKDDNHRMGVIRKQWLSLKNMDFPSEAAVRPGTCGSPLADYAHLVISSIDNTSLLSFQNVMAMCNFQSDLMNIAKSEYQSICERPVLSDTQCCPPWSIPNHIALISNKTSCFNITQDDVSRTIARLQDCASYFHSLKLAADCELEYCSVPAYCSEHNVIYNLLFFHIDIDAFSSNNLNQQHVEHAMIFLPLPPGDASLPYYLEMQNLNKSYGSFKITAIDFGLKNALFDLWLLQDTWLIALGSFFVFVCLWIYSTSFILTVILFLVIFYSIGISYFLYTFVFRLDFFPFMNLLVIVVVIGIGADDSFIFIKIWKMVSARNSLQKSGMVKQSRLNAKEVVLVEILQETLKKTTLTMFVTTLTTAVAFFVSFVSYIPAINCFSVFAGTAVLINFLLILIWLPAVVFLIETKCKHCGSILSLPFVQKIPDTWQEAMSIFQRFLNLSINKGYIIFVFILGTLGVCSCVVVFYYPGLQFPDSKHFQLFKKDHLFEQYDLIYKEKFMFERFSKNFDGYKMPLRWVWGVKAIDNGDHMNPSSLGKLVLNEEFSISDPHSQVWLKEFCAKIKKQPFYQPTPGPLLPNCFIESFMLFMTRKCIDDVDNIDRSPCCENSKFPYKKEIFEECILQAVESLYQTPRQFFIPGVAGPKFLRNSTPPVLAALVVEFESIVPYSMSYSSMNEFFKEVENWTNVELESAPHGMKGGWFVSDLQFYDLQGTLANGTVLALILSSVLGLFVLIPTTLSLVASICAALSMAFSVTVTVSYLILSGWKLNVLESIAISTSAGLAVDFNLHYALSYIHSSGSREARVLSALSTSAGPTAAAALTTGFAGIFLLSSVILPYSQIGIFLAVIMLVSWIYSTFFLCSLLRLVGRGTRKSSPLDEVRSHLSSMTSAIPHLEIHELEHLSSYDNKIPTRPQTLGESLPTIS